MSSSYGKIIRLSLFGQSHSAAMGFSLDGLPAGFQPDMDKLAAFMARRAPGKSETATQRKEADEIEFISGLFNGKTCGAPIAGIIRNTNTRSKDYSGLLDTPRPSHADYTANVKYGGFQDYTGGGHFSGRLTAPLCAAGGICLQLLEAMGIKIQAHILSIGGINDADWTEAPHKLSAVSEKSFPVIDDLKGEEMKNAILKAREKGDSLGGIIKCVILGMPAGVGEPMFDGLENRISSAVFAVPAIRGIQFGAGFDAAFMTGSQHNDAFCIKDGKVVTETNNHGGILGGISSGMPIVFDVCVKPTPSISVTQDTVSLKKGENTQLSVTGRHDPCIVPRAVPCIEAAAALALCDSLAECGLLKI